MSRIRVLDVIARMNTGGPARQVIGLTQGLDPARFEHRLLTGDVAPGETDDLALRGVSIQHRRVAGLGRDPAPFRDARALAAIAGEIRRFRPHVLHTRTAKAGTLGRLAAVVAGALGPSERPAVVHTFHGHLLNGYFSPGATRAVVAFERAMAHLANRLVAVGERVRDDLLAAGVGRPEQWVVISPGVELGPVPPRESARRQLGLPPDAPVVAYVGRLTGVKRPDRFVETARRTAQCRPDARFVVAGGGDLEADTRAWARDAGLAGRMVFLGWVGAVETVYAACDLVVLTSDNEGMPVSLIEAALAGRPAVTTGVGSAPEVVVDGRTGLVVRPDPADLADAVVRLLDDPARRTAMGAAAAVRARERFSTARLVADHAALYEELAAARRWRRSR